MGTLRVWNLSKGTLVNQISFLSLIKGIPKVLTIYPLSTPSYVPLSKICISHDGVLGAAVDENGLLHLWLIATIKTDGCLLTHLAHPGHRILHCLFSPVSDHIPSDSNEFNEIILDKPGIHPVKSIHNPAEYEWKIAKNHGSSSTIFNFKREDLYELEKSDCERNQLDEGGSRERYEKEEQSIHDVNIDRDVEPMANVNEVVYGKYLIVTCGSDSTAKLWRIQYDSQKRLSSESIELVVEFKGHERWIWDSVFSADGKFMMTASSDGTARLWETKSGKQIRIYKEHQKGLTCIHMNDLFLDSQSPLEKANAKLNALHID